MPLITRSNLVHSNNVGLSFRDVLPKPNSEFIFPPQPYHPPIDLLLLISIGPNNLIVLLYE